MRSLIIILAACATACGTNAETNAAEAKAEASAAKLSLPLYEEAVVIKRPVLPARVADGDCPGSDPCEFGTEWRACEAVPLYREAKDGAAIIRQLKPMEAFLAEAGEIELVAPGTIEITDVTSASQTGGRSLEPGAKLEAYGPLHDGRALYFDPATGRAFSPPADDEHWWWDGKNAKMTALPKMTWWVRAKTKDGARGWVKLANNAKMDGWPYFSHAEVIETWDTHRERDDETPDCNDMINGTGADGTPIDGD
jgi:hypothetical protein